MIKEALKTVIFVIIAMIIYDMFVQKMLPAGKFESADEADE